VLETAASVGWKVKDAIVGFHGIGRLVANGIAPFPALCHWDLPQALQDRGGWENRDTAEAFAQYAGYVAEKLGDRARHFHAQRVLDIR
jgi:beta-glucosidase/6-phospho-beta-glucosidase/beta-galactosidase